MISLITTCKGRLEHLKRSLPTFQAASEDVVVVDYGCPDGTGDYVEENFPNVTLVREKDVPVFNVSRARNLGARAARGDALFFCDADVLLAQAAKQNLNKINLIGSYATFRRPNDLRGTCLVARSDFERIGGYDEVLVGYSGEDLDLYMRLRHARLSPFYFENGIVSEFISHDDASRIRYSQSDKETQFLRGQAYQMAKEIVLRCTLQERLDLKLRRNLMDHVEAGLVDVYSGEGYLSLKMNFPDFYNRGLLENYEFNYSVELKVKKR